MKMKLIFLITILLWGNLFSQNMIQIIGTDESVSEYSIEEIENLTFDLENTATAKFNLKDGNSNNLNIDNSSSLRFANDMLIFENDASMVQVALADLESIEFEAPEQESRYPFGELDVDEVVVNNLTNPWSIDFIDNENLIFTELDGRLYTYNIPNADLQQIDGLPNITAIGQGGLIDVTLHPDFENNLRVYLVYSIGADWQFTTAVGYGTLNGNSLENFVEIFQGFPLTGEAVHFGSRIIFDNDGKLYFAIGDRGEQDQAQDKSNHYGSVLRINDDGTVPSDNPFLDDN